MVNPYILESLMIAIRDGDKIREDLIEQYKDWCSLAGDEADPELFNDNVTEILNYVIVELGPALTPHSASVGSPEAE